MAPFLLSPGESRNGDGNPSPLPANLNHRKNSEQPPDTPIGLLQLSGSFSYPDQTQLLQQRQQPQTGPLKNNPENVPQLQGTESIKGNGMTPVLQNAAFA